MENLNLNLFLFIFKTVRGISVMHTYNVLLYAGWLKQRNMNMFIYEEYVGKILKFLM